MFSLSYILQSWWLNLFFISWKLSLYPSQNRGWIKNLKIGFLSAVMLTVLFLHTVAWPCHNPPQCFSWRRVESIAFLSHSQLPWRAKRCSKWQMKERSSKAPRRKWNSADYQIKKAHSQELLHPVGVKGTRSSGQFSIGISFSLWVCERS